MVINNRYTMLMIATTTVIPHVGDDIEDNDNTVVLLRIMIIKPSVYHQSVVNIDERLDCFQGNNYKMSNSESARVMLLHVDVGIKGMHQLITASIFDKILKPLTIREVIVMVFT